ncbi:MAG: AAA family ATPase [Bacteroidota bacterium]|nr:AAA family ATPase [Bacteroidota bacterium]
MENARKTLKIGNSDFKRIVENNHYFVDKTLLIYDFYNSASDVLLIPRPRRFGKTLNLSMIEHFFDINKKESKKLFSEYEISKKTDFCNQHQNKYPVINLSLKSIKASNWDDCYELLKNEISELYKKHKYLLKSSKLESYEKQIVENLILEKGSLKDNKYSLKYLSEYLKTHFGNEVLILVDEYDTSIIYSYDASFGKNKREGNEKYYSNVIEFMRIFLGEAFKGNENLEKGLITGIMRIARESIFSEMNNFNVFSITSSYFSDNFGFTESETRAILKYYNLQDTYNEIKKWYDGYTFGKTNNIYNPWSIVNYIAFNKDGFKPYWVNTGSDILIKEHITKPDRDKTYNTIQKLLSGEYIEKELHEDFVFTDFDTDRDLLWTLLTFSGYLTQNGKADRDSYKLEIPNFEIKKVFKSIVIKWLDNKVNVKRELLISTAEYLVNNKIKEFEKGFKQIMGDTFSYFDTGNNPERIYQSYVLGLLAVLGDEYIIKSNRESGEGRYDILLLPHDKSKYGIVIEIKTIKTKDHPSRQKEINQSLNKALKQINKNKYYKELIENKIAAENIIKLPIVFVGKEVFIQNSLR